MPIELSLQRAIFSYVPCASLPFRHALPWAVPQSGQRLEGQRLRTLWRYRTYRQYSIGTLHASCRELMCARKAVGEVEVRGT